MNFETFLRNLFLYICTQASCSVPSWVQNPREYTNFANTSSWDQEVNKDTIFYVLDILSQPYKMDKLSPNASFEKIYSFFYKIFTTTTKKYNLTVDVFLIKYQQGICYQYSDYFYQQGDHQYITSIEKGFLLFLRKYEKKLKLDNESLSVSHIMHRGILESQFNSIPFKRTLVRFGVKLESHKAFDNIGDLNNKILVFATLLANHFNEKVIQEKITDRMIIWGLA